MEFTLDLAFLKEILAEERKDAQREIREQGPLRALAQSQQRHDQRIASAPDIGTLACHAGCTWCCYFTIDVRPAEVFRILDLVEQTFTDSEKARVYSEARANSATLKSLDEDERVTRNIRCPFLKDDRCTIYTARPQSCRNYHATDVAGCKQSFDDPDNLDIDPEFAPWVYQAGGAHVEAFSEAMGNAGFDVDAYEFNSALAAALADPTARQRFESGHKPFTDLEGEQVPPEFDDLDP